jgi:hypothetical protein
MTVIDEIIHLYEFYLLKKMCCMGNCVDPSKGPEYTQLSLCNYNCIQNGV